MNENTTLLIWCDRFKGKTELNALDEPRYYKKVISDREYDCECSGYDNVFMIYRKDISKDIDERFLRIYNNISERRKVRIIFEMPDSFIYIHGIDEAEKDICRICSALGVNGDIAYVGSKNTAVPIPYTIRINNVDRFDHGALVIPFMIEGPKYPLSGRSESRDVAIGRSLKFLEMIVWAITFPFPGGDTFSEDIASMKGAVIYREWRNYRKYPEWGDLFLYADDVTNH